jgi:hypothetical protein
MEERLPSMTGPRLRPTDSPSALPPDLRRKINLLFTEGAGASPLARADLLPAQLLDGDEIVILAIKPSLWFVLFTSARWLIALGLVVAATAWLGVPPGMSKPLVVKACLALAGARVGFALLQWVSRLYVLTNRRIMRLRGIFNVDLFECQLNKIQNTYLTMAWYERLASLGSISFATAGTGGIEATWANVNNPLEVHERVRSAIHRAHKYGNSL